ncbi:MAG: sulfite exporter TauE/SafE family protein [Deltaproteobacteria bacterium]|nr:sulfite exporter TauE/SafE family protein [Deltaproteobacteria bacterium]
MTSGIAALCVTAAAIGCFHTLFGPDHYLPFIVMSRARKWSLSKTAVITVLCGLGHVMSSVLLGLIGVAVGFGVGELEAFEGFRGNVAAWLLIGFGLAYCVWGLWRTFKDKKHTHSHLHDGKHHTHEHSHKHDHAHLHEDKQRTLTPWVLFTIFVLGPCEPLIPILMYPAAKQSISGMLLVTAIFAATTLATMLAVVMISAWGVSFAKLGRTERYTHVFAGAAICLSGLAIQFLGL